MRLERRGIFWFPSSWLRDDWLISQTVALLFLLSTGLVVLSTPVFLGRLDTATMSFWQRLPWGILGIAGPPGILFLWLGMWRYWFRHDESKPSVKRFWFVVLLIGFWFASCVYCFFVYLPQVIQRRKAMGA
jgi:uncharacterized BrkB/YihY/UPF0761 family membrane protein